MSEQDENETTSTTTTEAEDAKSIEKTESELLTKVTDDDVSFTDPSKKLDGEANANANAATKAAEEEKADADILKELLRDPVKVNEQTANDVESRVLAKLEQKSEHERKHTALWNEFYEQNQDLKQFSRIVESETNLLKEELLSQKRDITFADGMKIVAKRAHDLISSIRNEKNTEEVDTKDSFDGAVVSSSINSTPSKGKEPDQKSSFASQLKGIQAD